MKKPRAAYRVVLDPGAVMGWLDDTPTPPQGFQAGGGAVQGHARPRSGPAGQGVPRAGPRPPSGLGPGGIVLTPSLTRTGPSVGTQNVVVNVTVDGAADPKTVAPEVTRHVVGELRDVARAQTGNTNDFGRLV